MFSATRLHVELTNRCNAGCPQCPRTGTFPGNVSEEIFNSGYHELTLNDFKKLPLNQIGYIRFCGNYGDPIIAKDALDIFEYCIQTSAIKIMTNASLRNEKWWSSLAEIMQSSNNKIRQISNVEFSIDGLHDTNHLYRMNTNWDTIIKNAKAFIAAGGNAEWQFIPFKHNEHQVEEASQLATQLGFRSFKVKRLNRSMKGVSSNYIKKLTEPKTNIQKKAIIEYGGEVKGNFSPATNNVFGKDMGQWHHNQYGEYREIECQACNNNEMFIACDGDVLPCCWWGTRHYKYKYNSDKCPDFYEAIRNIDINIHTNKLNSIIDEYNNIIDRLMLSWEHRKFDSCNKNCGSFAKQERFHKIKLNGIEGLNKYV